MIGVYAFNGRTLFVNQTFHLYSSTCLLDCSSCLLVNWLPHQLLSLQVLQQFTHFSVRISIIAIHLNPNLDLGFKADIARLKGRFLIIAQRNCLWLLTRKLSLDNLSQQR